MVSTVHHFYCVCCRINRIADCMVDSDDYTTIVCCSRRCYRILSTSASTGLTKLKIPSKAQETITVRSIITTDKKPWLDLLLKIKTFFIGTTLFPWWFIICIYLLCHIYIAVATYFLIIYGVKFDIRANSWLQACAVFVVQDLFINSLG